MLHGIGLRPMSAQEGDFALCGERPKTLSLDSANPFHKRAGPQNVVTKTGSKCVLSSVSQCPKTVSLTNSLAQSPRGILRPRRNQCRLCLLFKSGEKGKI